MISKVNVRYFKRFGEQGFDLSDHIVLAGPNNAGKTTLLQAVVVWNLALQRWKERRGPGSGSKAKQRTGVPITRKDFTALPLREMNLLWTNTLTALRQGELEEGQSLGQPRVLTIALQGRSGTEPWELTFEFRYQNSELLYAKPSPLHIDNLPRAAQDFRVVHVPPFSGIGVEETRYDQPYQELLIGQGKAGDILRNLLLEVYQQKDKAAWEALTAQVEEIFRYRLLPPEYEGKPFILCEYLPGITQGKRKEWSSADGHCQRWQWFSPDLAAAWVFLRPPCFGCFCWMSLTLIYMWCCRSRCTTARAASLRSALASWSLRPIRRS